MIYLEWNICFDVYIYEGRVINMIINEKFNRMLVEVIISVRVLVDKCRDGNIFSIWVRFFGYCNIVFIGFFSELSIIYCIIGIFIV